MKTIRSSYEAHTQMQAGAAALRADAAERAAWMAVLCERDERRAARRAQQQRRARPSGFGRLLSMLF